MKVLMLLCALLSFAVSSPAAPVPEEFRCKDGLIADLPARVHAVPDKVTLMADFAGKRAAIVMLYLINKTEAAIEVPSQDGDVYCKREVKNDAGAWKRCDGHQYSFCGNSYISVKIPPGSFYAWPQRVDSDKGTKKALRFRMYQGAPWNLESNEGTGIVDDAEVAKCRYDQIALSMNAPFEDVAAWPPAR